jgi:acyl-CoA thioesterase YciA
MSQPTPSKPIPKELAELMLALRVVAMPKDTNPYNTIFGGVILSYIDQAAFLQARRHADLRWVTLMLDRVEFKNPVYVGDTINLYTKTVRIGRTSVTVEVDVRAERFMPSFAQARIVDVTAATLVMVSVDSAGRSIPFAENLGGEGRAFD